jgi:hypothetical protein
VSRNSARPQSLNRSTCSDTPSHAEEAIGEGVVGSNVSLPKFHPIPIAEILQSLCRICDNSASKQIGQGCAVSSSSIDISKHQLAALLDVEPKTIERFVANGKLPRPNKLRPVKWFEKEPLVAALRALSSGIPKLVAQMIENGSHDVVPSSGRVERGMA